MKPFTPQPQVDASDPINSQQIWWLLGNEGAGKTVNNIALSNPDHPVGTFTGTLQAGVTWARDVNGPFTLGDGTATGYVDLGTAVPKLNGSSFVGGATPVTFMWMEDVTSSAVIAGVYGAATIGNGSTLFVFLRADTGAYAPLTVGQPSAINQARWATPPTLTQGKGISRVWIVRATGGLVSNNTTSFKLMVDGVDYGNSAAGVGNSLGAFTGNNRIGWDSADNKFPGGVHNARLWTRILTDAECLRLCSNPFAGLKPRRFDMKAAAVAAALYRMFNAM